MNNKCICGKYKQISLDKCNDCMTDGFIIATADICPHGGSSSLCEWCGYKAQVEHLLTALESWKNEASTGNNQLMDALLKNKVLHTALESLADGLAAFFKDEPQKIALWLLTPNPHFGGVSPSELIAIRGEAGLAKVAKFVQNAREENNY